MIPNHPAWIAESTIESRGLRIRIRDAEGYLSFATVFQLLFGSRSFRAWYTELLAACDNAAICWEHPSLTGHSASRAYEVALIDAPALSAIQTDPAPFHELFAVSPGLDVMAFSNLGGDATLVAPTPVTPTADYSHLLSFLRTASERQVDAFWQCVATTLRENLSDTPVWLSTAGGGVNWLHVRVDSYPKYYKHPVYRHSR
jgi:hypothetical protein